MDTDSNIRTRTLPLQTLNHFSLVCSDTERSLQFYRDVLGFIEIRRPSSFDFDGRWLFRGGTGLHLVRGQPVKRTSWINPKSDHFSFVTDSIELVMKLLKEKEIPFVTQDVMEGGITINQVFFHDPDHNMIEICNCDQLPVIEIRPNRSAGCVERGYHSIGRTDDFCSSF
eukprot:g7630.t1